MYVGECAAVCRYMKFNASRRKSTKKVSTIYFCCELEQAPSAAATLFFWRVFLQLAASKEVQPGVDAGDNSVATRQGSYFDSSFLFFPLSVRLPTLFQTCTALHPHAFTQSMPVQLQCQYIYETWVSPRKVKCRKKEPKFRGQV